MQTKKITCAILAAVVAAVIAGCEGEHATFVQKDVVKFDQQRLNIMFQVAEQQYKVGDLAKCRESLKSALEVKTPYAPIHVLAARVELEGGNLDVAATQLKEAITIDGSKPEPYYLLGVVYQRWQKFETACDYYQQASEKNPGEALYVLAVAEMYITQGQLDKAKQLLEDKMLYFEQSAAMRIALARIATLQHDPAAAARFYRDATMLLPEDANLRWTYSQALYDAGKYSDAARILEDLRHNPPVMPKALMTKAKEQPADTETDLAAASSVKVSILMTLGECYVSMKRPMDARDCFQEILREQPANVSAYLALAKTCLMMNDLATTTAAAQKALRYEPENVQAMLLQAAVLQKQEKWTESLEMLDNAARISPKDMTVLCMQGIAELQRGRKDAAADYFQKAVAISPTDTWANELLARVRPGLTPAIRAIPATPAGDGAALPSTPVGTNTPAIVVEPPTTPAVTNAMPGGL